MPHKWLTRLPTVLYPPTCVLCQAPSSQAIDLCIGCLGDLPRILHPCRQCGSPLPAESLELCGACQTDPPAFDATIAPFRYALPINRLLAGLKFQGKLMYARILGDLTAQAVLDSGIELPECVIPVPLHARRLRERGFNQARELARYVARRFELPIVDGIVTRTKDTRPQMELDAKQRFKNMRDAFALDTLDPYQHVAVLDDVMTTGNTVGELARTLKVAGVKTVDVWTVARTHSEAP